MRTNFTNTWSHIRYGGADPNVRNQLTASMGVECLKEQQWLKQH